MYPGDLWIEGRLSNAIRDELLQRGHKVEVRGPWSMNESAGIVMDQAQPHPQRRRRPAVNGTGTGLVGRENEHELRCVAASGSRVLLAARMFPILAVHAVQVPDHSPVAQRHLATSLRVPRMRRRAESTNPNSPFTMRRTATSAAAPR